MGTKKEELTIILYNFIDEWNSNWTSHEEVFGGVDAYSDEIIKLFEEKSKVSDYNPQPVKKSDLEKYNN
jgi:hypothetical protein